MNLPFNPLQKTIFLAPMEGVVDWVLRDVYTAIGGYDFCVTEFVRVTDNLHPKSVFLKYCPELLTGGKTAAGTPVFVQLLGGKPEPLAENAARAVELGALGIDLNFGCPAKTVNRHDGGAILLKQPERIFKMVEAVRKAVPPHLPASAKMRLGYDNKDHAVEIALGIEAAGASWLAVHARTKMDMYQPPAYWEEIAKIREVVKIPVIANGEIWSPEDAAKCLQVTSCHVQMIGRGALAQPYLAKMIKGECEQPAWTEIFAWIQSFFTQNIQARGEKFAVARIKQWTRLLGRNYPECAELFQKIKLAQTEDEIINEFKREIPSHAALRESTLYGVV